MKNYKLGVGPMSHEIIKCINDYGDQNKLMVVASRNQADYNSGYVCTSGELADLIHSPNILICRDHCGPYFSDADKDLSLSDAIDECKKTITEDIRVGFDLIHIDVSRIPTNQLAHAKDLIEFTLDLNTNIMLEFGSEDNTGTDLAPSVDRIDEQLDFINQYADNIVFFVTQTGSFIQHKQVGHFDIEFNKPLAQKIHDAGFLFKEHNADYLRKDEVNLRDNIVDALNVAPQLGTVQTRVLKNIAGDKEWYDFSKRVIDSNLWTKWLPPDIYDKELAVIVAGHYLFNTLEYKRIMSTIDVDVFAHQLKNAIFEVFNTYLPETERNI